MTPDRRVRMADRIATVLARQPGDRAGRVAAHVEDVREPRMRAQHPAHLHETGGAGPDPLALSAGALVTVPDAA